MPNSPNELQYALHRVGSFKAEKAQGETTLLLVEQNNLWGMVTTAGLVVVPPTWEDINEFF